MYRYIIFFPLAHNHIKPGPINKIMRCPGQVRVRERDNISKNKKSETVCVCVCVGAGKISKDNLIQ